MSAARPSRSPSRKPNPWIRRGIAAAVVVAVAAVGFYVYSRREAEAATGAFRTVPVERGDIRVAISSTGTLSAISTVPWAARFPARSPTCWSTTTTA